MEVEQINNYREQVIEAIAETMDLYGAPPSIGRLYGILFFEDKPFTLDEMKDIMGMSKSSMSYAVRTLLKSKMVEKLPEKKIRKELFKAESDFFQAFKNFFTDKLQYEIDVMTQVINEVLPKVKDIILKEGTEDETRQIALRDLHKLNHAMEYYKWLQLFVDHLKSGRIFDLLTDETTPSKE